MKSLNRLSISAIAALATLLASSSLMFFWLPVLQAPALGVLRVVGSLVCAVVVARYTWRHTALNSQGPDRSIGALFSCIFIGAVVTGVIGFSAGFFGPLIFAPGANQGPLIGILVTGPLGFPAGAVGGAIYWLVRSRTRKQ